jgi:phospholipid/cholesterol/gamma-HCH transport system substrate-binding protein
MGEAGYRGPVLACSRKGTRRVTGVSPRSGLPRARSGFARRTSRLPALAALLIVVLVVGLIVLNNGGSRTYRVMMENAGQLVPGDLVRIGGVQAGTVKGLDLTPNGQAVVDVEIGKSWGPLHAGTTVTVRASGIATVTGRYVDISPGPSYRPKLADNAEISVDDTHPIVDIDQLINTFRPAARKSLQRVIKSFSTWYAGRTTQANESAVYFPATLQAATHLFDQLGQDSGSLQQFLTQTGTALHALSVRRQALTSLVSNARTTLQAIGSDNQSLSSALVNLPPALRQGSNTFVSLRAALPDLRRLVRATDPVSRTITPFLVNLQPTVHRAVPAFRNFRLAFDQPGPANDLLDALHDLPSLARLSDQAFPQAVKTLDQSEPVLSFIRPYTPDLVAFARSFGGASATYDANGHYARTVPVFDGFAFNDDPAGGTLTELPPKERGTSPYLSGGHVRRCPGASLPSLQDASAPFVDNGPLANPDCDPSEVIK